MNTTDSLVRFIVQLGDGSEHAFELDTYCLRHGDSVAFSFAVEYQLAGRIPPGDILSVRRASPQRRAG